MPNSVWGRQFEKDVLHCDLKMLRTSDKSQTFSAELSRAKNIKLKQQQQEAPKILILLAANHLVAVVLLSELPKRRLNDTTTKTQNKMKS